MKSAYRLMVAVFCFCLALGFSSVTWAQNAESPAALSPVQEEAKQYLGRGLAELDAGNFADALDLFEKAIELSPENPIYRLARGRALFKMGFYEEAEQQFRELLDAGPQYRRMAFVELGAVYGHAKLFSRAVEAYTSAIELDPNRASLYLARGIVHMELEQFDQAEQDFQKALTLEPGMGAAVEYHRGLLHQKQENYQEARARLDHALELNPDPQLGKAIGELRRIVEQQIKRYKPWSLYLTTTFMKDDNVTQEPTRGQAATTNQDDYILGINASLSYYFENKRANYSGIAYSFSRRYYRWHSDFDYEAHILSAFWGKNADPWYFRLRGEVGKYLENEGDLFNFVAVSPTVVRLFGIRERVELSGLLERTMSVRDIEGDSTHFVLDATYFHTFRLPRVKDELPVTGRLGLKYEGENFEEDFFQKYRLAEFKLGISFPLPMDLEGDVSLSHAWVWYDRNLNIDAGQQRDDSRFMLMGKLGRNFGDTYRVDLIYSRTDNDSTVFIGGFDPHQYTRDVVLLMFTAHF